MSEYTLSLFDPNTLLPHRAGIAGLALALSVIDAKDAPLSWAVTEDSVSLTWEGFDSAKPTLSDRDAVKWLLDNTYRIKNGYLDAPALKLDQQSSYTFTRGITASFLQHSQQRKLAETTTPLTFQIEEGQPEIKLDFRPLLSCYYTGDLKEAFNTKGDFKPSISLKGHHLPGLVECFANGAYQESPSGFLSLLFLPLACGYYQLPNLRSAVVIPEVHNLKKWIRHNQNFYARTYRDFRSSGAGESALRFLVQEKTASDADSAGVDYCEVYQLGGQTWDGQQKYLKQAVHRVKAIDRVLEIYRSAYSSFPAQVKTTDKGEPWLAISKALPWICDNLVASKPWHKGFFEFRKQNDFLERKGLVTMTEYLNENERVLFDAVQGAFSSYLRGQHVEATRQGRKIDYGQVTDKVVYRLQRPSTQQEFATALVDFLSQFRSKAMQSAGPQIYSWIHGEAKWRSARDLALLAVATYTSKKGDALDGADISIESTPDAEDTDLDLLA